MGSSEHAIKGFLCQVRKISDGSMTTGTFDVFDDDAWKLKTMTCDSPSDSVTHTNNIEVESVQFMWTPSMGLTEDVYVT